ncbi:uncharacterized protein LOC144178080 [Haemaphysalis longicornis]
MVLVLTILLTLWVWVFLSKYDNSTQEESESVTDPDRRGWLRQATTERVPLRRHLGDQKPVSTIPENTEPNDNDPGSETNATDPDFVPFPTVQDPLGKSLLSSSHRPQLSNVCLHTHRGEKDTSNATGPNHASPEQRHDNGCDILIECCAFLGDDMRLTLEGTLLHSDDKTMPLELLKKCSASKYRSSTSLLTVRSRYLTFRRLLEHGTRTRSVFVQDALRTVRANHYAGIRFWFHDFESEVLSRSFISGARKLAARLRTENCTLGFFLANAEATRSEYMKTLRLLEQVLRAPQSLLLYPSGDVFRNKNTLLTPKLIASLARPAFKSESVCYLLNARTAKRLLSQTGSFCFGTFHSAHKLSRACYKLAWLFQGSKKIVQ